MKSELEKVTKAWPLISRAVRVPHTEADYRELVELLDRITDEVGEDLQDVCEVPILCRSIGIPINR